MYLMNDDMRRAATLLAEKQYIEARDAYRAIYERQPEHKAMAASQVGVALFCLGRFDNAVFWVDEGGRLGVDAQRTALALEAVQRASNAQRAGLPVKGSVVIACRPDGSWAAEVG